MDRIDLFRIFSRVVECASFTRASDSLGMPRSTVSTAIQELEERVGARLLHRTTRQVSPTQDGRALYERCQRVIAYVEETESLFRETPSTPAGRLRIDVPSRIGRLIIAPALQSFLDLYPQVDVIFGATDRAVNLLEDSVDIVLRVGPVLEAGLATKLVGRLPILNVASPLYLDRYGTPQTPEDLSRHLAVHYLSPSTSRIEDWEWIEDGVKCTRPMRGRVIVNNAETYIACCISGIGLAQVPSYDVRVYLEKGELIEVLPSYRAEPMLMTLIYPHKHHPSYRVQAFISWIEKLLVHHINL